MPDSNTTWKNSAILFREASRTSRQWQTYATRTFFSGALLGILLTAIAIVQAKPDFLDPAEMAKYGRGVFVVFAITQVVLAIGLAPLMVANAVIQERQSKQFELIGLTNIRPKDLFIGIVFSRLLQIYTIILGGLPVLALVVQLGGVSIIEVVMVIVHTLVAGTVLGCLGGLFGLFTRSATLAVLPTTFFAGLLFIVIPSFYGLARADPWAVSHLSPFMASQSKDWWSLLPLIAYLPIIHLTLELGGGIFGNLLGGLDIRKAYSKTIWHPKRLLVIALILGALTPVTILAGAFSIAVLIQQKGGGSQDISIQLLMIGSNIFLFLFTMLLSYAVTWISLRLGVDTIDVIDRLVFQRKRTRKNPKRLKIWSNPVLWREAHPSTVLRYGFPLWGSFAVIYLISFQFLIIVPGGLLLCAALNTVSAISFAVWWTGEAIRRDQRSGLLEILLTTTLSHHKIIFGKMMSGLAITLPMMLASSLLFIIGSLQLNVMMRLFWSTGEPFEPDFIYPLLLWVWTMGLWYLGASLGAYTAVRTANPRISFITAASILLSIVVIPAAIGNLAPDMWLVSDILRFIAPGVIVDSSPLQFAGATTLAVLSALLLTTKTVRHLGRAIAPLLLLSLLASPAQAADLKMGVRPIGDGLVKAGTWSAVDVQLTNPDQDTSAIIKLHTGSKLNLISTRKISLPKSSKKLVRVPFPVSSTDKIVVSAMTLDGRMAEGIVPLDQLSVTDVSIGVIGVDPMGITGIFETWTGGVPGLDFRDEASSSRKVRTALFDSQTLPDNPLQLTSFDLIVWPQPQPDELSSDQLNALTSWVANGGNLFLSISETWKSVQDSSLDPLLPVELTGLDDNDEWRLAFKTFPLKAPKETTAPIVRATLRDTAVPLSMITKTQPLWALSPHGMGTVSVFLADINIAPFGRNQHRGDLWRTLLWVPKADASPLTNPFSEQQLKALPLLHAMISANDRDKDPSLKKARKRLADIDGISPWPVRWLLFFAGAYLLLIGPIDYISLRLLEKQPLTWVTFPLIIIVFSTAALLSARLTKGSQASGVRLEFIELIPGTTMAQGGSLLSIYSTAKTDVSISSTIENSYIAPLSAPNFVNTPTINVNQDKFSFNYSAETWTLAYLQTEWYSEIDDTIDIINRPNGWKVTNNFQVPLWMVRIIGPTGIEFLQAEFLLPGESLEINANEQTSISQARTKENPEGEDTGAPIPIPKPLVSHPKEYPLTLVAELESPYEILEIVGVRPELSTKTLVRVQLNEGQINLKNFLATP